MNTQNKTKKVTKTKKKSPAKVKATPLLDLLIKKQQDAVSSGAMDSVELYKSGKVLIVHSKRRCAGQTCTVHNPSVHSLRGWPQHWRGDRALMERISPWGCGCPDPDEINRDRTHGCVINPAACDRGVCSPWEINGVRAAWIDKKHAIDMHGNVYKFNKDYLDPKKLKLNQMGEVYLGPLKSYIEVFELMKDCWGILLNKNQIINNT